jgi:sodium-dependent dicarboxylate transporter 2/3/5
LKPISFVKYIGLIIGPVLFFILSNLQSENLSSEAWKVLGLGIWMVIWWATEAAPIPATALLPIVVYPLSNVASVTEATAPYASPIIFLFMGGFLIALGLEKHNLHKRIALNLIKITGTHANGIILGFMISTAFLSMWISNTATAVMMLPIAMSVIGLMESSDKRLSHPDHQKSFSMFSLGLLLSIAYSANVGGTATIIGTPPNVVLVGFLNEFLGYEVEFSQWLLIGIPISVVLLGLVYIMLTRVLYPNNLGVIEGSAEVIQQQLTNLGKLSKEEKLVTIVFTLTACGWIFKQYINMAIGSPLLNDTVTAMAGGVLMFIVPVKLRKGKFLMKWSDTKRLPWGILILFGGGLSLARGMESTGLIQLIGDSIAGNNFSIVILTTLLITTMLFMTEVMSNVALTTIFIPVVLGIAQGLSIEPLGVAIPVTLAASCAFMMPISTPPNAIVFASGRIKIKQMMQAGFLLNLISILVLAIAAFTIIKWVFP